jgi:acetoin utilization deacetylase AcuC-like enzyme
VAPFKKIGVMKEEESYSLDYLLDLTKTDKDTFWKMLYDSVKKAIGDCEDTAVIFQVSSDTLEGEEITSISLDESQFETLLENYLHYSEKKEDYEKCIEIKSVLEEYKETKKFKGWK